MEEGQSSLIFQTVFQFSKSPVTENYILVHQCVALDSKLRRQVETLEHVRHLDLLEFIKLKITKRNINSTSIEFKAFNCVFAGFGPSCHVRGSTCVRCVPR